MPRGGGPSGSRDDARQLRLVEAAPRRVRATARELRTAALFAGVGGFELGLGRAGHSPQLLCESDPAANAVLDARLGDLSSVSESARRVARRQDVALLERLPRGLDLVAAGFPCQDLSQAGRVRGIRGANSGLVRHVFRLLEPQPRPRFLLLENVPFMLRLNRGRALNFIVTRLEELGYAWAYRVVDSMAFGLPQRRERVFLVAVRKGRGGEDPRDILFADEEDPPAAPEPQPDRPYGFYWTEGNRGVGTAVDAIPPLKGGSGWGIPSAPAVLMPDGRIVTPSIRGAERLQGFAENWTEPVSANGIHPKHRWRLVGNAVNVEVATWLGRRLASPGVYVRRAAVKLRRGETWPRAAFNVDDMRCAVDISSWPMARPRRRLSGFLRDAHPLSANAAGGFLYRLLRSGLAERRREWFVHGLREHVRQRRDEEGARHRSSGSNGSRQTIAR